MKNQIAISLSGFVLILILIQCNRKPDTTIAEEFPTPVVASYGGFESQLKWGEHLVTVGACHVCHTPKKVTATGWVLDSARWLSGHPAASPPSPHGS